VTGTLEAPNVQAARATLRQMEFEIRSLQSAADDSKRYSEESAWNSETPQANVSASVDPLQIASRQTMPEESLPWNTAQDASAFRESPSQVLGTSSKDAADKKKRAYVPLVDTFRLYAGWLLVWYVLIFGIGSYQATRTVPFRIGIVDGLFTSPLILHFSFACFLFLLMTTLYKLWGPGMPKGVTLTIVSLFLFALFIQNA